MAADCTWKIVPGPQGAAGTNGTNGVNGGNAYTTITAATAIPGNGASGSITVGNTAWLAPGQKIFIRFAGTFTVETVTSATTVGISNPRSATAYTSNSNSGSFTVGANVVPAGAEGPSGASGTWAGLDMTGSSIADIVTRSAADLSSGVLAHERGGLEADVSAYSGLIKISGGTTSQAVSNTDYAAAAHASRHLTGGADEVDGDKLDIDWTPANYTPTTSPAEADSVDNLTAHLAGVDAAIGAVVTPQQIVAQDRKATTTDGGTFTSGGWQARDLNTEVVDTGSNASIAANEITLDSGTYEVDISAPGYQCVLHQARLWNVTDGVVQQDVGGNDLYGTNEESPATNGAITRSRIVGRFTLGSSKALRVEHRCSTTKATTGLGSANSFGGPEIYTVVNLRKVA